MTRCGISILGLTISLLSSGCVGFERYVEGNTFYSTGHPAIKVELSNSYEYLGETKSGTIESYDNAEFLGGPSIDRKEYTFKNMKDEIKSFVTIEIVTMESGNVQAYFTPFNHMEIDNVVQKGNISDNSDLYYYIFPNEYTTKENMNLCLMNKYIGKNVGDKTRFQVNYIEMIPNTFKNPYPCRAWTKHKDLKEDQIEYLDDYNKRSSRNITFVENWEPQRLEK